MSRSDWPPAAAKFGSAIRGGVHFFGGSPLRLTLSVTAVAFLLGLAAGYQVGQIPDAAEESLASALQSASHFEKSERELRRQLLAERELRRIADYSLRALAQDLRTQDEAILKAQQQLAFQRRLLQEQGAPVDEIDIRSFDINPDFREHSYRLAAVLIRQIDVDSEKIAGRLDLALSLADDKGNGREYRPVFEPQQLQLSFHHYLEIDLSFSVPAGYEILNAQLNILSPDGETLTSRLLYAPL